MKIYTNEEIKNILDNIKKGVIYTGICNNYGVGKITVKNNFIEWEYYGRGTTRATKYNLRLILEDVFYECDLITAAKYSKRHTNYIPKDKKYNGADLSIRHKNIWGC